MKRMFAEIKSSHFCLPITILAVSLVVGSAAIAASSSGQHPLVGKRFVPENVDYGNPVYKCSFDEDCVRGIL